MNAVIYRYIIIKVTSNVVALNMSANGDNFVESFLKGCG